MEEYQGLYRIIRTFADYKRTGGTPPLTGAQGQRDYRKIIFGWTEERWSKSTTYCLGLHKPKMNFTLALRASFIIEILNIFSSSIGRASVTLYLSSVKKKLV